MDFANFMWFRVGAWRCAEYYIGNFNAQSSDSITLNVHVFDMLSLLLKSE